ncbi:MAG: hypothetical protein JF616_17865 [Fibrobacteres bacterium]|jgi:hypothetical protein|nr:hypothetical protein [Fibrobacterota bacterium]
MKIHYGYLLLFSAIALCLATGLAYADCASPAFTTSDPNGGWSTGGYYVHNNMWNSDVTLGPETLTACSYHDWYVVSNQTNEAGAVKTYPNVHKDYDKTPISSFKYLTTAFAATSPHVGIYDVAYDIWLNGVATAGSNEIMIWTENYKQVPAGTKADTITLSGHAFNVWKTKDNSYIAFVPVTVMASGTIDLLALFNWTVGKGWIPSSSTLGQICFGVEIVSTNGADAKFTFSDFSINTTPSNGIVTQSPTKATKTTMAFGYYTLTGKRIHGPRRPDSIKPD